MKDIGMEKELILTAGEWAVAKEYAKGLQDKEVAENLGKSVWTTKTQKKNIYLKLGISTSSELTLYVICRYLGKAFDLKRYDNSGFLSYSACCSSLCRYSETLAICAG